MIGKLCSGRLRGLDLLVRMRSDLVVRLVERDLLDAVGVEDDFLSRGCDVVEKLDDPGDETHLSGLEQDGDGDPELLGERETLVFDLDVAGNLDLCDDERDSISPACMRRRRDSLGLRLD